MSTKDRFTDERTPDVFETEASNPNQFLSTFQIKEQAPFKDRTWFKVLAELCYAYHARPQEEFRLSGAGKQALWVFNSLVTKKIASLEIAELPEVNNYEVRVTGIDYNSNSVFLYNTDDLAQIMAEIKNGSRKLEYISYDQAVNAEINQTVFNKLADAIK